MKKNSPDYLALAIIGAIATLVVAPVIVALIIGYLTRFSSMERNVQRLLDKNGLVKTEAKGTQPQFASPAIGSPFNKSAKKDEKR